MKLIIIILSFLFFTNCSYTNTKYAGNEIETSSVVTVKPKVINESAFENFYMSEKLEKELNKIQFTSTSYLRSNKDCIGIIRLSVSGSIDSIYHAGISVVVFGYYTLFSVLVESQNLRYSFIHYRVPIKTKYYNRY